MKINFVLPSCQRPSKFFAALDNLREMCMTENYEVICILEETDLTMNNQDVKERLSTYPFAKPFFINSTGKINAINQGLNYLSKDYDIIVVISDDFLITMKGWDFEIESDMQKYFPDLSGALHYPDGIVQDRQITMAVLGRKLVEKWEYIYHPSYKSLWADTEMLYVVKKIGKHKYIDTPMFKHLHPVWKLSEYDELYRRNEAFYQIDSDNYFKRLAINFDL